MLEGGHGAKKESPNDSVIKFDTLSNIFNPMYNNLFKKSFLIINEIPT